uniref:Uncharacterized protein n=1 Tax=Glossina pallidipes TaxID=7398 RepID=A0A1A9Z8E5_GLOPL
MTFDMSAFDTALINVKLRLFLWLRTTTFMHIFVAALELISVLNFMPISSVVVDPFVPGGCLYTVAYVASQQLTTFIYGSHLLWWYCESVYWCGSIVLMRRHERKRKKNKNK